MSSIMKGLIDEGENVAVIYIDGKPVAKYSKKYEAEDDAERIRKKFPNKKIEIKQEVREAEGDTLHDPEYALPQARRITKAIKYDGTVGEIITEIQMLAERTEGIDSKTLEYSIDGVLSAKNALESAVYGLEEAFEDAARNAQYKRDDVDEGNYHDNRTGFKRGPRDDERHDLDVQQPSKQVWGLKINGKVWSKDGVDVTFASKEQALKARQTLLAKRPELEIGLVTKGGVSEDTLDENCWKGYHKEGNKELFGKTVPNCVKNENVEHAEKCPHCGGEMVSEELMNEKKDACYYKVKSRYKVWPSAYASGALVKCRKKGASNWGNSTKNEDVMDQVDESLRDWFKEKWVRFGPDGKIRGDCARGDDSEGKPKCLPQSKAHSLGKKGRASAASRKRREDPNPERSGKAINVNTKKKTNENMMGSDSAEAVYNAVLNRIMRQHLDIVSEYGPKAVMYAIEDVANGIGDLDEIGSSDVSIWTKEVISDLKSGQYAHLKETPADPSVEAQAGGWRRIKTKPAGTFAEDTAYAGGMGQGGNAGQSYRKFKPKSAGTFKESSIMKGLKRESK